MLLMMGLVNTSILLLYFNHYEYSEVNNYCSLEQIFPSEVSKLCEDFSDYKIALMSAISFYNNRK